MKELSFPDSFIWGCATSAYQIEGAAWEDGKGASTWDSYVHKPGKIRDGSTGDVACDHYHRWEADLDLLSDLGVGAYRFSVSWPRVFPQGRGSLNHPGLDFYDRLVDGLLARGIEPFVTLFHWDLPLALEEDGGWLQRRTAGYFADYAEAVARRLGDRVSRWMTLNEPLTVIGAGYLAGRHAPGYRNLFKALRATHNLLLAHGSALSALRAALPGGDIGIANAFSPAYPARSRDQRVARRISAIVNGLFMDPIFKGHYPKEIDWLMRLSNRQIRPGDMELISAPVDFVGVNHYTRFIAQRTLLPFIGYRIVRPVYDDVIFTEMNWEVYPPGLYDILQWLRGEYGELRFFITENGAAFDDRLEMDEVRDTDRIEFLRRYLEQLHRAMEEGCRIDGYFVWSFMDNFEWEHGLSKRFGLVHVNYRTLQRTVKQSGHWYSKLARTGTLS
jgi:beta-glucosidase